MNKLILCEGKTDAILLSYYLGKMRGWESTRKGPKGLEIRADEDRGESAYWYRRGADQLLICGVGGKDNFGSFFDEKIKRPILDSTTFSQMAVVTDRDNREEKEIQKAISGCLEPIIGQVRQNEWTQNRYRNSFGQQEEMEFLLLIIPTDKEGALEALLLEAISEDPYDRKIVERCGDFVDSMEADAGRYLKSPRLKLKSRLGVTWAIQSPGKEFHFIDQQIRAVPWESYELLSRCFAQLFSM